MLLLFITHSLPSFFKFCTQTSERRHRWVYRPSRFSRGLSFLQLAIVLFKDVLQVHIICDAFTFLAVHEVLELLLTFALELLFVPVNLLLIHLNFLCFLVSPFFKVLLLLFRYFGFPLQVVEPWFVLIRRFLVRSRLLLKKRHGSLWLLQNRTVLDLYVLLDNIHLTRLKVVSVSLTTESDMAYSFCRVGFHKFVKHAMCG